ncbi:MAG: ABC transporter ATP-binding protein [Spirochaetes bacterium]|nr:ABC transporter ATP-binding protein [Spirochaetota bacterium]
MNLEIKNLSKTYPNGVQALKNVSLSIGKGMFGLLGENGAGKSTLMRIITTLQDADTGEVTFEGINAASNPMEIRKRLGYLPQEFGVYPSINAEEMLLHLADLKGIADKGERKEQVNALLSKVNLWNDRKKKLCGYSGGMKQRFGIAQALLGDPKLIIVDEPTAGLDPVERNRFYNLLSEIGENNVVILSTHIVEDVSTLCNNMAIMANGEVIQTGTPAELENSLADKLWVKEIQKEELEELLISHKVIANHFHLGKLSVTVMSDKEPGNGFNPKEASLEDVYFNFLGNIKESDLRN